jgi:hypothetical protein
VWKACVFLCFRGDPSHSSPSPPSSPAAGPDPPEFRFFREATPETTSSAALPTTPFPPPESALELFRLFLVGDAAASPGFRSSAAISAPVPSLPPSEFRFLRAIDPCAASRASARPGEDSPPSTAGLPGGLPIGGASAGFGRTKGEAGGLPPLGSFHLAPEAPEEVEVSAAAGAAEFMPDANQAGVGMAPDTSLQPNVGLRDLH